MIHHILKTCTESNLFNKIHVSTDSIKIKKVVEKIKNKNRFFKAKKLS